MINWTEIFETTAENTIKAVMAYKHYSFEKAKKIVKNAMMSFINGDMTEIISVRNMIYWATKQGIIDIE